MRKLPFSRSEVKLARILAEHQNVTIAPKMATLIGKPEKAWDAETEATVRKGMRGADNTDTE